MVGKKYGKLTVLARNGCMNGRRSAWDCSCECGKNIRVQSWSLKSGNTRSCGCINTHSHPLPPGEAGFNKLLSTYKRVARDKDLEFSLSREEFRNLTQQNCFYCNTKPTRSLMYGPTQNGAYIYNGIDRVDNSAGYIANNVRPCCKVCNYAKNTMTEQEFYEWIKSVYNNLIDQERLTA